jgi:hypothetical protein
VLRSGESVNLERTNGERVEFIPPLRDKAGRPGNDDKNQNVNISHDGGNSSTYRIAKLKRDAPEFAERLQAGEFRTVRRKQARNRREPPRKSGRAHTSKQV